ncbi:MAG: molybdopterin oxidoreductase, partial [Epsilonproteobacteria bacterium]|nr:molybdopterin oxidoreductase [Campylobacterota bacterium]NPA89576.1 molybdopterin oxidoreductase [Campylobacterota bacterium]
YLCKKLRNYFRYRPLFTPRYRGKEISWEEGLNRLVEMLQGVEPEKILYLKGSGNMGILQNLPPLFFAQIGATFAVGSSCDGMGAKGIGMGRGKSSILPLWVIKNAERVLIWGRNVAVTNTHLLPLIAGKKVAVIDIRPTKTAKIADHFYQILPNRDYYLALLLGRLALERVGEKNLNSDGVGWERYRHLLFRHSPEKLRQLTGLRWKEVEGLLEFLLPGAVVLTGLGVAKHREGWKSSWAIDSLFHLLGYFGKPDRGVAFLGSSSEGLNLPFSISPRRTIPLFDIHPGEFDLLFLQGGNPAESYPNRRVWEKLLSKKSIVFGRYWDRSAQLATLFIPTEGFYNKPDCRGSYFDQFFRVHFPTSHLNPFGAPPRTRQERKLGVGVEGISESNLTRFLMEKWGFPPLPSDGEIIAQIVTGSPVERVLESNSPFLEPGEFTEGQPLQIPSKSNSSYAPESFTGFYRKKIFDSPPYRNGFPTPSGKFHFLQVWLEPETPLFWVATGKGSGNLNSQFSPPEYVEIAPNPVPPLRRWVEENLSPDEVKINPTLPPYLLFAPGGKVINRYLKSEGENAYYTSLEE